jgi:hypothetical protein
MMNPVKPLVLISVVIGQKPYQIRVVVELQRKIPRQHRLESVKKVDKIKGQHANFSLLPSVTI